MQMSDRRDEWLAGCGHQLVFQWSDLAKSFAYRAESSHGLVEKLKTFSLLPAEEVTGSVLKLWKVSRMDMGAYMCIARNGVPPAVSKRIELGIDCT